MKIPKPNQGQWNYQDYNLTFVHIKGTDNILVDAISRLKTRDIYMKPPENPKTAAPNNTEE